MRRTTITLALTVLLAGCGGAVATAPAVPGLGLAADSTLPPASGLDAIADSDPESAYDALLTSYVREAAGDVEGALDALLEEVPWGDPAAGLARSLRVHGLRSVVPGFDARVATWLTESDDGASPVERMIRGELRLHEAYRAHRRTMQDGLLERAPFGSPTSWRIAGPFSSFEILDFDAPTPADDDAVLADEYVLPSGPVRTWWLAPNAAGASLSEMPDGIYVAETFVGLAADSDVLVAVSTSARYVVEIDGHAIARRDIANVYDSQLRLARVQLGAGAHRVRVRVAMAGPPSPLWLKITPLDGVVVDRFDPTPASWSPTGCVPRSDPVGTGLGAALSPAMPADATTLAWLVAAELAVAGGDAIRAGDLLDVAADSEHPLVAFLTGRLAGIAFHRRPAERSELAVSALRRGLDQWPGGTGLRVALASLYLEGGQTDVAGEHLEQAVIGRGDTFAVQHALSRYYEEQGWAELAREARLRAAAIFPLHCPTVSQVVDDLVDRGAPLDPAELPSEWLSCDATHRAVATAWTRPRGDFESALETARRLASRNPDDARYAMLAAETAWALGLDDEADAFLTEARRWLRRDDALLDLELDRALALGGDPGWAQRIDATPSDALFRVARAVAEGSGLLPDVRYDGVALVEAYLADAPGYQAQVVYVHDYAVSRYFDDGSGFELVHQIVQLNTRDALAAYGEIGVPAEAVLVTARTLKPDGRALVPDDIAGKESLSMPNLEIGDFVELEWLEPTLGPVAERPAVRSGRFTFRGFDGPFHRSIQQFIYPEPWADAVAIDLRNFEGDVTEERADGLVTRTYEVRASMPPAPDSRAVSPAEWLPSVRFAHEYDLELIRRVYADVVERGLTATPEMAEGLGALLDGAQDDRERLERIFRLVSDDVPDFGGFFGTPAAWTWSSGEGERLPLVLALLRTAGYDPDLVFVRPWDQDWTETPIRDLGVYDLTAVRVSLRGGDVWMEPDFERYPFDYLRPDAQGCEGIVVVGPAAGAVVTTPRWPREHEQNRIDIEVVLDGSGDAQVSIEEHVPVRAASSFRLYVETAEDRREMVRELEGALSLSFPGVELHEAEFEGLAAADGPITLRYSFSSSGLAEPGDGALVYDGQVFERPLASWYAERSAREHAMLVYTPVVEVLTVRIVPPEQMRVVAFPDDSAGEHGANRWSRTHRIEGGALTVRREIEVPVQRVARDAYPAFADLVHALEDGARMRVEMRPEG